jgi:hypothetical protein
MSSYARIVPAVTFSLLMTASALAQESRVQLAAKGGATIENSEDNLTGTVPAFGLTASARFTRNWRAEFEFWLPGYIDDARGEPKHRDVVFSLSAVRTFDAGRVKPFVVMGLSFTRTQDWFTFCTAHRVPPNGGGAVPVLVGCDEPDINDVRREKNVGTDGYLLGGGGVEIPVTPRISVIADLRVNLAPVSVLVRPSAGVAVRF